MAEREREASNEQTYIITFRCTKKALFFLILKPLREMPLVLKWELGVFASRYFFFAARFSRSIDAFLRKFPFSYFANASEKKNKSGWWLWPTDTIYFTFQWLLIHTHIGSSREAGRKKHSASSRPLSKHILCVHNVTLSLLFFFLFNYYCTHNTVAE